MAVDLFAGIAVGDLERAVAWYGRLLGAEPSFRPNATGAVWTVDEIRFVYVAVRPDDAGHGLEPAELETYDNGVRKATFRDPDGNEIGFGGAG